MTTKTKYTKHNKRKNARAKNKKKAISPDKTITVAVGSPTDTLADKIRQCEEAGADSLMDLTAEGRPIFLFKNPSTGVWEEDADTNARMDAIMAELGF